MNLFKKTTSVVMAMAIIFLQGVTAFAAETTTNIAGEPIDVLVNGKYVAKGEVVVIEESFGIRITEIMK